MKQLELTVTVSPEEAAHERPLHYATDKGWLPEKSCCNCGRKWPCIIVRLLDLRDQADAVAHLEPIHEEP